MTASSLAYTYRYPFASALTAAPSTTAGSTDLSSAPHLRLATCTGAGENPHFFAGAPRQSYLLGKILLTLSDVVRTHYDDPIRLGLLDPVVTASESMLRFEGFSTCCGVYVRADLPAAAFEAEIVGRGTTNVDFNDPMRKALARLRDHDEVRLAVGQEEIRLERGGDVAVEKKVRLPVRWLKGFGEVQAYQADLEPKLEARGGEALRFLRTLPRSPSRRRNFIVQSGRTLRLSPREQRGAVPLAGTHRARVLERVLVGATGLRIWGDEGAGVSAWEIEHELARFVLVLSPEVHRGFSGEGQLLDLLADGEGTDILASVRAQLHWQTRLEVDELSAATGLSGTQIHGALATLGARGLAGYDLADGGYFHRELPFDGQAIESLQPRLKTARKLLEAGEAKLISPPDAGDGGEAEVEVRGTKVRHRVRLGDAGQRCTCRWWSRYQGRRGPCKHILVARLLLDSLAKS